MTPGLDPARVYDEVPREVWMTTSRELPAPQSESQAPCPECGAPVPLVADRWLLAHWEGSSDYAYPRGQRARCPGSFLPIK